MNVPQMQQNLEHAQMQETILKAQLEVSKLFQCVGLFVMLLYKEHFNEISLLFILVDLIINYW